ncbi:unnamed protein product [Cylicocyclus nassatus]|uniref:Uncharacterized protein n=1 Tax=Cylicocyclus nassatus TaxID=53992 RepID=A0AA36GXJ0_CYLNA|nr:unnamed protein product [Cylicocyclus nassatus]
MPIIAEIQKLLTTLLVIFSLYSIWYIIVKQDIIDRDRIQRRRRKQLARRKRESEHYEQLRTQQNGTGTTMTN